MSSEFTAYAVRLCGSNSWQGLLPDRSHGDADGTHLTEEAGAHRPLLFILFTARPVKGLLDVWQIPSRVCLAT